MLPKRLAILLVEDEAAIADAVIYALETEGFATVWKRTAQEALDRLARQDEPPVALVVLDIGLPDINGFDVCREIRRGGQMPVIFLTARNAEVDRIVGLELGADDYVAKPFSPRELSARVRAVLRRTEPAAVGPAGASASKTGDWQHDPERCRISYAGRALELTRNEYRLLGTLLAQPGRVFTREQLMNAAWDDPLAAMDRTVDAHVKMLRAKLREIAPDLDLIVTHRGLGYSLREE